MSDEAAPVQGAEAVNKSDFTPITTQEDLNKVVAARIERERSKFGDYDELKTKASEFDKLADAQKSETQRAIERADAAEKRAASLESETLRLSVIAKHGIPEEYQEFVTGATEEELLAKAEKVKSLIPDATPEAEPTVRELVLRGEGRAPALALNGDGLEAALKEKLGIA